MGADDKFVLLAAHRTECDFLTEEFFLQLGLQLAAPIVEEMVFLLVAGEGGGGEDFAFVGPEQKLRVDLGMLEKQLDLLARDRIKAHDGGLVASKIGGRVEILVVVGEKERTDTLAEIRAEHFLERLVFRGAGQQLGVDPVGLHRGAHFALMIGDPGGHAAGVFRDEFHFAVARVEAKDVEDARVALVHANEEVVLVVAKIIDHSDPDPGKRREVAAVGAVHIDRVEVEIFIPAIVLQVNNLILRRPEIAGDVALGRIGQAPRFAAAIDRLDKNIEAVFPRRHPRDKVAARADLIRRALRVAEKVTQRDDRRWFCFRLRVHFHGGNKGG